MEEARETRYTQGCTLYWLLPVSFSLPIVCPSPPPECKTTPYERGTRQTLKDQAVALDEAGTLCTLHSRTFQCFILLYTVACLSFSILPAVIHGFRGVNKDTRLPSPGNRNLIATRLPPALLSRTSFVFRGQRISSFASLAAGPLRATADRGRLVLLVVQLLRPSGRRCFSTACRMVSVWPSMPNVVELFIWGALFLGEREFFRQWSCAFGLLGFSANAT